MNRWIYPIAIPVIVAIAPPSLACDVRCNAIVGHMTTIVSDFDRPQAERYWRHLNLDDEENFRAALALYVAHRMGLDHVVSAMSANYRGDNEDPDFRIQQVLQYLLGPITLIDDGQLRLSRRMDLYAVTDYATWLVYNPPTAYRYQGEE